MFKNERAIRFVVMVTPEDLKGIVNICHVFLARIALTKRLFLFLLFLLQSTETSTSVDCRQFAIVFI